MVWVQAQHTGSGLCQEYKGLKESFCSLSPTTIQDLS